MLTGSLRNSAVEERVSTYQLIAAVHAILQIQEKMTALPCQ
ncbi:hypothetical protein [Photorhabdus luminescens]|nr:hypothetical protein [Photorhabdus luminescens]